MPTQIIDTNPLTVRKRLQPLYDIGFNGTLPIQVNRYFTTVDGLIIDDSLVPAAFQLDFPVYLLGDFDRNGGYKIAQQARPVPVGAYFLTSYISGTQLPFPLFTGLSDIETKILAGDLVTVFCDSLSAPSYFCYIIQSFKAPSQAGWGSILSGMHTAKVNAVSLDYYAGTGAVAYQPQFNQLLRLIQSNAIGNVVTTDINPLSSKNPLQSQNQFINIPIAFTMNHLAGMALYMLFSVSQLQFNFKVSV